jgi:hypothetical protein
VRVLEKERERERVGINVAIFPTYIFLQTAAKKQKSKKAKKL